MNDSRQQATTTGETARRSTKPHELIAQAGLPDALGTLVLRTVDRTRLWRSEKIDVTCELIAHFQDGLDAERSAEDLARDFGDPEQAARLIRRAKKRNRPVWWKSMRFAGYGLVLLIVLYALLAVRFFTGEPTIATDYLAKLNQDAAAVAPDERAWLLYRQALLALGETPQEVFTTEAKADAPGWLEVEAYLNEHADVLALVREAASKPGLGFVTGYGLVDEEDAALWPDQPLHESPDISMSMFHVPVPYLGEMRTLSQLLAVDTSRAALAGESELVIENITAILSMAEHVRELPTLINDLVSIAILTVALDTINDLLAKQPDALPDDALTPLSHRLAGFSGGGDIRMRYDGDRYFFEDIVQRTYTDDGRGGGRLAPHALEVFHFIEFGPDRKKVDDQNIVTQLVAPSAMLLAADRRDLMRMYERMLDEVEREGAKPLWQRDRYGDQEMQELTTSPIKRMRYGFIYLLMPALHSASRNAELATQRRDATLTALVLEHYRREHGAWPQSLDALVPRYLPGVPRDRFHGGPIKYTLVDGEPVLYSVGNNRTDHGGTPPPADADGAVDMTSIMRWRPPDSPATHGKGDWILWTTRSFD